MSPSTTIEKRIRCTNRESENLVSLHAKGKIHTISRKILTMAVEWALVPTKIETIPTDFKTIPTNFKTIPTNFILIPTKKNLPGLN